jgi:LacI family transcriptional regulator
MARKPLATPKPTETPIVCYVDANSATRTTCRKLDGIRRFAAGVGWEIMALNERESRPDQLAETFVRIRPAGCIVECSTDRDDLPRPVFGGIPTVYLDCRPTLYRGRVPMVCHDNALTAHAAYRELSFANPCAFGVVGNHLPAGWSIQRERAFKAFAAADGIPCRMFTERAEEGNDPGRFGRLCAFLAALPPRSAVFAVNDHAARVVLDACRKTGRSVPADIIVLGVDNASDVCELCSPPLSSIQVDFELAGYRAAELLLRTMRGDASRRREMFGPLLVVRRDSTRGHARTGKRMFDAIDLIRRQACEGLRAIDVVKALGRSRRLAEMRFRETFGRSILEAITDVRMDRVAQMLCDPSVPISTVVTESGFNSSGALRKVFRIRTGLSLSAWRKLHVVKASTRRTRCRSQSTGGSPGRPI